MQIKFFWTWAALQPTKDNTYFLIEDWKSKLQVDCWGGLWLAQRVRRWEISFNNLFITHSHSDHLLGFFHLLKIFWRNESKDKTKFNIYCSKKIESNIRTISGITLWNGSKRRLDNINFFYNDDLIEKKIWDFSLIPLNLNSIKMEQYGFLLKNKWKKILFFWDEAINILERDDLDELSEIDYLICEALIPEYDSIDWGWNTDLVKFQHISAKQAWKIATKLNAKNLILIHTREIEDRVIKLKKDAELSFNWNIIIPNDWYLLKI